MKKRKEETGDLFKANLEERVKQLEERVKQLEEKVSLQNETLKTVLNLVRDGMG